VRDGNHESPKWQALWVPGGGGEEKKGQREMCDS